MGFKLSTLKVLFIGLFFLQSAYALSPSPLSFGTGNASTEQYLWDELLKYKIWGRDYLTFEGQEVYVTEKSGYTGTKGNFTLKNTKHTVYGPVVVGGNISTQDGTDLFDSGYVRVGGSINVGSNGDASTYFKAPTCVHVDTNNGNYDYTPDIGDANCPIGFPVLETSLNVPTYSGSYGTATEYKDGGTLVIDGRPTDTTQRVMDLYYEKITLKNGANLMVRQKANTITRIFVKNLVLDATGWNIGVTLDGATMLSNNDYSGTLLIYTESALNVAAGVRNMQGTFVSASNISIAQNLKLAGQLIGAGVSVNTGFNSANFRYVPFDPPVVDPEALATGIFYESVSGNQLINFRLDREAVVDVEFKYYVYAPGSANYGKDTANNADFLAGSYATVSSPKTVKILKDETTPTALEYLRLVDDSYIENTEVFFIVIEIIDGAILPNGGFLDTLPLSIVDNDNEQPPAPVSTSVDLAENSANGTLVYTLAANDPNASDTHTFTLLASSSTNATAAFAINATTGAITVLNSTLLNYEGTPNTFTLDIQVTDQTNKSATASVTVNLTNVNEAPTITNNASAATATISVAENQTAVVDIDATDVDASTTLTYSLVGGADQSKFSIVSTTGVLTFVTAPNFEVPTDADGNNTYIVQVRVSDGALTDVQTWTVTVTNVNEAPTITSANAINVSENQTAVLTVVGADVDAATTFAYSVVGGVDQAKFAIDAATGVLTFVAAPNFEIPTDIGTNNVYDVIVQVSDGALSVTQAIAVTVTNVNEAPTDIALSNNSIAENVAANFTVGTLTTTDVDAGNTFTYTLVTGTGATDNASFTITGNTVTINASPNFEAKSSYSVRIRSTDQDGLWFEKAFTITITNINEAPTITNNGSAATAAISVSENQTAVVDIDATDVDASTTLTYSLVGGADQSKFSIVSTTGVLTFVTAPNFEVPTDADGNNTYIVQVRVSDGALTDVQTWTVTVTNVNEAPTITSANAISVSENQTAVLTAVGADVDAANTFAYSVVGGADQAKFAINAATGVLTFVTAPDFEVPGDVGTNNVYDVIVQVSDGALTVTQAIAVTVTNVNEAPTDIALSNSSIAENVAANFTVGTLTTTDVDAGNAFTYSLVTGTGSTDNASFNISGSSLRITASPNFEAKSSYSVRIRSTDQDGLWFEKAFTITITNVNEAPTITNNASAATAAISVAENQTAVVDIDATDVDASTTLTYSLVGGADQSKFSIVSTTGVLTFVTAPDFEIPTDADGNNTYIVQVRVSDGAFTDVQTWTVTVTNVNEAATITSANAISVSENQTAVLTVVGADVDAATTFAYSVVGGADQAKFAIDVATGVLTFVAAPNFEIPTDIGTNNVYDVIVQVSDGALTVTQAIAVTVTNLNEAPTDIALSNSSIAENVVANFSVGTLTTTDVDAGNTFTYTLVTGTGATDNASFTITGNTLSINASPNFEAKSSYSIRVRSADQGGLTTEKIFTITITNVNEAPTITSVAAISVSENQTTVLTVVGADVDAATTLAYSIVGGVDASKFTIDAVTGALTFVTAPDFELPTDNGTNNIYNVNVQVSDGALTATQAIAVTVTNVNEAPTDISLSNSSIPENSAANTTVGDFSTTDVDAGNTFTYTLVAGSGSTDNSSFTLSGSSLIALSAFDFETKSSYSVRIRSTDQDGLWTEKAFTISVTNVNEAPTITSAAAVSIYENQVTVLTLVGVDVDASSTLTYTIAGGVDGSKFIILPNTNVLLLNAAANFEDPKDSDFDNVYLVDVRVSDGSLSSIQSIAVTILNQNEAPSIINNLSAATASINAAENMTSVVDINASDVDAGTILTYSLSGGADLAKFQIDASTGVLTFIVAPDFESPTDVNGDNVYVVQVSVSDGELTDEQTWSVTVTNRNEAPTITSVATASVPENQSSALTVVGFDIDVPSTLAFVKTGGVDASKFIVDPATGVLSFNVSPDFEVPTDVNGDNVYEVEITVTDGALTYTQSIAITVTNVNEAPTDIALSNSDVAENVAANFTVGTLTTIDVDAGNAFTYTLVTGIGSTDNASFAITSNALKIITSPNFESKSSYSIRVRSTDQGGLTTEKVFVITISDANEAPTDITLFNNSISENVAANFMVGNLTTIDVDAANTFTYTLVAGIGSTDNASFSITGNSLSINASPDFEAKSSYSIRVRSTDQSALSVEKVFTIVITNVNEKPVLADRTISVSENAVIGYQLGTLTATDVDASTSFQWSILSGNSPAVIALHASTGVVTLASALDYESVASYVLQVVVTDNGTPALKDTALITIQVLDANELPVAVSDSYTTNEDQILQVTAMGVLANDSDVEGDALSSILAQAPQHGTLTLQANGAFEYIPSPDYFGTDSFQYTVNDGNASGNTVTVTIQVMAQADAPVLTPVEDQKATEDKSWTLQLQTTDTDPSESFTYSIVSAPSDMNIDENSGMLHWTPVNADVGTTSVTVRVVDASGLADTMTFALQVVNTNDAPSFAPIADQNATEDELWTMQVQATDPDVDDELSYSVSSTLTLVINATTGVITAIPTNNDVGTHQVTVTATDAAGVSVSTVFTLVVHNANDAPVVEDKTLSVIENADVGTTVGQIIASDIDVGDVLTYEIIGGSTHFSMDSKGEITVLSPMDYEMAKAETLSVVVTDGVASDTARIIIQVTNQKETTQVEIIEVKAGDSTYTKPDTLLTNDSVVTITWTHNGVTVVENVDVHPGVNQIIKTYKDPATDLAGSDTIWVVVNQKVPQVTVLLPPDRPEPTPNTVIESPVDTLLPNDPENPTGETTFVYYINDSEETIYAKVVYVGKDMKLDTIVIKINPDLNPGMNTVEYTYTDPFGNTATGSVLVFLDLTKPVVKILRPADSTKTTLFVLPVEWTVDGIPMDTLNQQSLIVGDNFIIRTYRDRAGNVGSDTVYVMLKDNKKNISIAMEQPLVQLNPKQISKYYEERAPKDDEYFALSLVNTLTGQEEETQLGKGSKSKPSDGSQPYPGLIGKHLGPTVRVEVKLPSMGGTDQAGKMRGGDLQSILESDGRIALTAGSGEERKMVSLDEYLENYCFDDAFEGLDKQQILNAPLYKATVFLEFSIYDAIGQFVDKMKVQQEVNSSRYLNDGGMLTAFVEMKPRRDGTLASQTGRAYGTGAYVIRAMVRSVSVLQCDLPSAKRGTRTVYSNEMLEPFGFRRSN